MKKLLFFLCTLCFLMARGQVDVEPPHWWTGFKNPKLQLLVHGEQIGKAIPSIDEKGIRLLKVHTADSPNYLFLDLLIEKEAKPGKFDIVFTQPDGSSLSYTYELKGRTKPGKDYVGFDSSDAIYLITPDRFANGDTENDVIPGMFEESVNRKDDYARHGGDIQGIIDHLDYISDMGFTAIWSSPLLENDMKSGSYHGYAMTDFYDVDPRFGTLDEYRELAEKARDLGMKLIMDQVVNHAGVQHWWMKDLPFEDWINYQERYENGEPLVYSSHRRTVNQDPYAANVDKEALSEGWFVASMPDLNQRNAFMAQYLIQNSIWWIETLGLGGIRQDTYPYPDMEFMSDWAGAIMKEYPRFTIVGEEWSTNPLLINYWLDGTITKDGYDSNLPATMDFAMQSLVVQGLNEKEDWGTGLIKLYEGLANDFFYTAPQQLLVFADNHDMSRIYTQLGEDLTKTKMAMAYLLVLPRIPQVYYGTEILMDDTEDPGDHGLIRTDFPGGWEGDAVNAFTGEGLSAAQKEMQSFLKRLLNYRKESTAIQEGKTLHYVPVDGVYLLARYTGEEKVILILNKNEEPYSLDLERFRELGLQGTVLTELMSGEKVRWQESLELPGEGPFIFVTEQVKGSSGDTVLLD